MGHIFVSYSHKDTAYVTKLVKALEHEGFSPWIDERLDYGSHWPLALQENLDTCEAFIVLMTPNSLASEWVQSELSRARRKDKPIFPLLLEGDETWLSVESTQYVDVRGGILPPEKFYLELAEVATRGDTVPVPAAPKPSAPTLNRNQLLMIAAGVGATLILLIAGILAAPKLFSPPISTSTSTTIPTQTLTAIPSPTLTQGGLHHAHLAGDADAHKNSNTRPNPFPHTAAA